MTTFIMLLLAACGGDQQAKVELPTEKVDTEQGKQTPTAIGEYDFALIYQGNVVGEIEPCG